MNPFLTDDNGRGPVRLRRSRINVYDIIGYLDEGADDAHILYWLPICGPELEILKEYIAEHRDELMMNYRRFMAQRQAEIAAQQAAAATPEGRRRAEESRTRFEAFKQFVRERKQHPEKYAWLEALEGDDYRREQQLEFQRWRAAQTPARPRAAG